jgi:hypothetical protein
MNQSGKKISIFIFLFVCLLAVLSACATQTPAVLPPTDEIQPTSQIIEATPTPTIKEIVPISTITPTIVLNPTPIITRPTLKVEFLPTFNATLNTDHIMEPHLLAIYGKYNDEIAKDSLFSFAPDGKSFILQNGVQLSVWRSSPLKEIRSFPLEFDGPAQKVSLSEDNHYAAVIFKQENNETLSLKIWQVVRSEMIRQLELGNIQENQPDISQQSPVWEPVQLAFIPGTNKIAYKLGSKLQILDAESDDQPIPIQLREDMTLQKITFTRDGRFMYVLLYSFSTSGIPYYQVQIWDTDTLQLRESVALEEQSLNMEVDLQAAFLLVRNTGQLSLQKMNLENEEMEDLPYRLGKMTLSADGHFLVIQHVPEEINNRQVDIELWAAYNWRKLFVMDNDGDLVTIDYPIDLTLPGQLLLNQDHTLMAICTSGKTYLYDTEDIFSIK